VAGTGPKRRVASFGPRYVFFYLFILLLMFLCCYRHIYYFNTLRYDGGEGMAGARPKRRDTSFGPRYVFFILVFILLLQCSSLYIGLFISITTTQRIGGNCRQPGPNDATHRLGPGIFNNYIRYIYIYCIITIVWVPEWYP
jgi:hypothetical protein